MRETIKYLKVYFQVSIPGILRSSYTKNSVDFAFDSHAYVSEDKFFPKNRLTPYTDSDFLVSELLPISMPLLKLTGRPRNWGSSALGDSWLPGPAYSTDPGAWVMNTIRPSTYQRHPTRTSLPYLLEIWDLAAFVDHNHWWYASGASLLLEVYAGICGILYKLWLFTATLILMANRWFGVYKGSAWMRFPPNKMMLSHYQQSFVSFLLALSSGNDAPALSNLNKSPIVTLPYGSFQGKVVGNLVQHLGIPFAAPPYVNTTPSNSDYLHVVQHRRTSIWTPTGSFTFRWDSSGNSFRSCMSSAEYNIKRNTVWRFQVASFVKCIWRLYGSIRFESFHSTNPLYRPFHQCCATRQCVKR